MARLTFFLWEITQKNFFLQQWGFHILETPKIFVILGDYNGFLKPFCPGLGQKRAVFEQIPIKIEVW